MKIVVYRDDGTVIDSFEGVFATDARPESLFWQAMLSWLLKTVKRGEK